jgi:hypothetical protein
MSIRAFDVLYLRAGEIELLARVYQPEAPGPFPVLLDIHGGAWNSGAKAKAAEIREANFASNPVLPAEDNCPCGRGWLHSKHVDDPTRAVDIRIQTPDGGVLINSNTTKADPNYELINKLTSECDLFWGINFTQIPQDPIHWELRD